VRIEFQGQNVSVVDSTGREVLDSSGNPIKTVCNKTTRALDPTRSHRQEYVHGGQLGRRGVVDTIYYEFEPGQIKLADFAANGARCAECLTKIEIGTGQVCSPGTPQYVRANSQCTSNSWHAHKRFSMSNSLLMFTICMVLKKRSFGFALHW
jgi:hypothetical protein